MRDKKNLTDREKAALYGLVRFPEDAAVKIAKELEMPQPTFSNIQRRLRKQGLYSAIGMPDLRSLGLDIVSVIYGTYNPLTSYDERKDLESDLLKRYPEIFYKVSGLHDIVMFLVSTDIVEINNIIDEIEGEYMEKAVLEKDGLSRVDFTLPTTLVPRFFDYSKTLFVKFKLEDKVKTRPAEIAPPQPKDASVMKLNKSDSKILLHLLDNPDASDVAISKKLKLSRTTVSRAKKKLISKGIFKRLIIPNIEKMGFEVFVLSDTKFNPETTMKQRLKSTQWLMAELPVFLSMVTNKEAVTLYAFLSYHGFQRMKRDALVEYKNKGYIKGGVAILVFSVAEIMDHRPPHFAPIVRKVLGL